MKKKLLIICICLISIIFLSGCSIFKKELKAADFIKIAEQNDLVVTDVIDQASENEYILTATAAEKKNDGVTEWQVEHYAFSSKEEAIRVFLKNKANFENKKTGVNKSTNVEVGNYTKYTLDNGLYYMVVTRVGSTFVYANVPIEYKEEAMNFIKAIGY